MDGPGDYITKWSKSNKNFYQMILLMGFLCSSVSKESALSAGDPDWIPGLGRSPGKRNGNTSILAWKISWTEEPGGLQSMGSQRIGHD